MTTRALIGLIVLGMLLGFLVVTVPTGLLRSWVSLPAGVSDMHGPQVPLSDAGRRVASGLTCPCGCPDLLLACNCANSRGAGEVKSFINEQLAAGRSEAEVRVELINRYGADIQKVKR